ncbi:diaminopropionate ammonia-lyase [Nisaea acidiphila]|uniref:Diaminopropionate ammonia-lyase n=1 Tax=Nisaea acidiphila TaxID=1862145 RepID=A0A9J7ATG6_9PROT|nr:diaminopropionate ammonia-lyase [Nisaea acidiphila]UUX49620.1 diaminopropionate ammonia-lyase [Nisaea acidiphila]
MNIERELTAPELLRQHAAHAAAGGAWPESLEADFPVSMADDALAEISSWPGYAPTPLESLDALAAHLGLGAVLYKDEGPRFGLGSFKALGGAYAVMLLARKWLAENGHGEAALADIRGGKFAEALKDLTVTCATDGNHGRSVSWGAEMAGCRCVIFIHAEVSEGRKAAMEGFGAEVRRIDGDYDMSLKVSEREAEANGWFVVSDASWPGYLEIPRDVMAGYTVMASEVLAQADAPPTHMFVQAGVGGFAAAMVARLWQKLGADAPRSIVVEPDLAACAIESARQDKPAIVPIHEETLMAGLSCGEMSLVAWPILSAGCTDYVTVGEEGVGPAMRLLASGEAGAKITGGESGVAGLLGLLAVCAHPVLKERIGLGPESRVLLIGSEGATDPEIYRSIVGDLAA